MNILEQLRALESDMTADRAHDMHREEHERLAVEYHSRLLRIIDKVASAHNAPLPSPPSCPADNDALVYSANDMRQYGRKLLRDWIE